MRFHPARLNQKKRDGGVLNSEEIQDLVHGITHGEVGKEQLGAFLMAVCCTGMGVAETTNLTLAMRDSGKVLDLSKIPGRKIDKHSTGGVGDKVSLLLAPLVAACGVPVPMISGRGLGHTGGTIDKLAAIPGYRTGLDASEFLSVLGKCGYVMAGASAEIAPADRIMYAARDISGTVESIPLITASILSKKLAEGIDGLVMDVKCGRAAFMKSRAAATALMKSIVRTGKKAGTKVVGLLTDMDTPLGLAIGNALEVAEIVQCFKGKGPRDLLEVTFALGAEMLVMGGKAKSQKAARGLLEAALGNGGAERLFRMNVALQGGDPAFVDDPKLLGRAPVVLPVPAARSGYVVDVDPLRIGLIAMDLGAGRRQPEDRIDPLVGIVMARTRGDKVEKGELLAEVHARDAGSGREACERVGSAFRVGRGRGRVGGRRRLVLGRMG